MKKISRRSFLAVCGAMAATAALTACGGSSASTAGTAASGSTAGSVASGEVFELKLSTTQTDTSMIYQGLQAAADKVAEDTPADLKGAVIRTPGADPYVESISAMGATPYNIAWSEVYNGIQTKSIDGCEVQYTSAVSSKIYEVCEYVSKTEHINLFNMVICGQAWFDKLPAEYQEVMKKDFNDCAYNNAQDIIAAQDDMEKTLTDNGMTIVEVDKDIFREAVKPAYEKLGWTELREQLYKEAGVEA